MKTTAKQIANLINGRIEGDENVAVSKLTKIDRGEEGSLSFVSDAKYDEFLYTTKSSIVVIREDFVIEKFISCTAIRVKDPHRAFVKILQFYDSFKNEKLGISKQSFIAKSAKIGRNVYIGEGVVVGEDAKIGDDAKIYPQTYIGDKVTLDYKLAAEFSVKPHNISGW